MKEIDEFLQFLLENESDERIDIYKKMKYGYRYYYVSFSIDEKPEEEDNNNQSYGRLRSFRMSESIDIVIDNRNSCIEITYEHGSENIIYEDKTLVEKWSSILEEYINRNISEKTTNIIEKSLSSCYNKNLYRTYQMKKILPDNESL